MQVTELKFDLQRGDMKTIAEVTKTSYSMVTKVLGGFYASDTETSRRIIEVARRIEERRREMVQSLMNDSELQG